MSPDRRIEGREPENGRIENTVNATTPKTKNRYDKMEWAGAFGDVGTLIPLSDCGHPKAEAFRPFCLGHAYTYLYVTKSDYLI